MLALGTAVTAQAQEAGNEIVVTAAKREQALREIPASVSAMTGEQLQNLNAQSLSDYITRVPGVVFNDYQPGVSEVVIRGVASTTYHEANQATTGYYLNEIPLTEPGFPLVIPDIDAFDMSRVEVLRGPQGTLFGSSSLGGAVNYVVNEADPGGYDAMFEAGVSTTKGSGGQVGYSAKAMINAPLINDKLAVRIVALQRVDAGYLDNPALGEEGSNDLRVRGLRGSIVFTPTETTKISALSMYQEYDLDDQTYVFILPTRNYERPTTVPEYQDTDFMMHSLRLDQELGFATLTALGSYTEKNSSLLFDYSFGDFDARTGTPIMGIGNGHSETEYGELRLTSTGDGPFRWLVGANYTHMRSNGYDRQYLEGISDYVDANPGEFGGQPSSVITPDDNYIRSTYSSNVTEKALFGEISYDLTEQLTLTLGGRVFEFKTRPQAELFDNIYLIPPYSYEADAEKQSGFIPKASLSFKPNDDFMIYALYSEGFRIGGINVFALPFPDLPMTFESDTTQNYEIGTRFDLAGGAVSVDLTAYHIDWNGMQARLFTPDDDAYTVNGGGAEIDGVELSLTLRPTRGLSMVTNVSYNDARLSDFLPDTYAVGGGYAAGTRLPGASEWILSNELSYTLLDSAMKPRIGIAHRYMSEAPVAFGAALEKGDFHTLDINASAEVIPGLDLSVFAKNVTNSYGILSAPFSFAGSVSRPRTFGLSLRYSMR